MAELYEPVDYLNRIVMQVRIAAIALPLLVLLLILAVTGRLVNQAQADICYRSELLAAFREKLRSLMSDEAFSSMKSSTRSSAASGAEHPESRRVRATILFSDIRGFTGFCESCSPEEVVAFLNQALEVVIRAVQKHGGDVDKMIGDAVLACFQGEDSPRRALEAACAAQKELASLNLPRRTGIGIFTGDVVMGTIGAANRKDFTVIGDSVNSAARLCSAAGEDEIVIDSASFDLAGVDMAMAPESLPVKGRQEKIRACRITPAMR